MDFNYDESTKRMGTRSEGSFPGDYSRENLVQFLLYLEGEIEKREKVIENLKEERANGVLFEAKYALACPGDPVHALTRDSSLLPSSHSPSSIGQVLDTQAEGLERIISGYNESFRRTLHVAQSAEHRFDLAIQDLEVEREWKNESISNEAVLSLLEENRRLKDEIDRCNAESTLVKTQMDEAVSKRQREKDQHKTMVLFLMNERKELLSTMREMQFLKNNEGNSTDQKRVISDLRKQLESFIEERETMKIINKSLKGEIVALKEIARAREEENNVLKKSLAAASKEIPDRRIDDGSRMTGNGIEIGRGPSRSLSSSSSFPSDKSRLPRVSTSSPITNLPVPPKAIMSAKKTPAMGVSTMRRAVERRGPGQAEAEPSRLVRSSSLRGQSEPRPLAPPSPSIRPSTLPKSPSNGANVSPVSSPSTNQPSLLNRVPSKSDGKVVPISKPKSSILRPFGK